MVSNHSTIWPTDQNTCLNLIFLFVLFIKVILWLLLFCYLLSLPVSLFKILFETVFLLASLFSCTSIGSIYSVAILSVTT